MKIDDEGFKSVGTPNEPTTEVGILKLARLSNSAMVELYARTVEGLMTVIGEVESDTVSDGLATVSEAVCSAPAVIVLDVSGTLAALRLADRLPNPVDGRWRLEVR